MISGRFGNLSGREDEEIPLIGRRFVFLLSPFSIILKCRGCGGVMSFGVEMLSWKSFLMMLLV